MSHDIQKNTMHAVITMQVAIDSNNPDEIADGLNEFLRPEIGEGFLVDYAFYNTEDPLLVMASAEPEEGELFHTQKCSIYPDMEESAESLTLEYFDIDSLDDLHQKRIDDVDHLVATAASDLACNDEVSSALVLLGNTHKSVADMLKNLIDISMIRDHVQSNTN